MHCYERGALSPGLCAETDLPFPFSSHIDAVGLRSSGLQHIMIDLGASRAVYTEIRKNERPLTCPIFLLRLTPRLACQSVPPILAHATHLCPLPYKGTGNNNKINWSMSDQQEVRPRFSTSFAALTSC